MVRDKGRVYIGFWSWKCRRGLLQQVWLMINLSVMWKIYPFSTWLPDNDERARYESKIYYHIVQPLIRFKFLDGFKHCVTQHITYPFMKKAAKNWIQCYLAYERKWKFSWWNNWNYEKFAWYFMFLAQTATIQMCYEQPS